MDQLVEQFFQLFERANASSDFGTIGELYADTFMFGGINGVRVVKRDDFVKVVPGMKARLASLGLAGSQLQSVEATAIGTRYILAKIGWRMILRDLKGSLKGIDVFATYVLERKEDNTLSILLQIDHQDLATVIKIQQSA